jgi:hypothetical protein
MPFIEDKSGESSNIKSEKKNWQIHGSLNSNYLASVDFKIETMNKDKDSYNKIQSKQSSTTNASPIKFNFK